MAQIVVKCGHLLKHTAERCLAVNSSEFWSLWDMHLSKMEVLTGKAYTKPMSKTEFDELNDYLDSVHGDN